MTELFENPKGKSGRPRIVTAKAWISRKTARGVFRSNVSLGEGRVYILSTGSRLRPQALEFNRSHLLSKLTQGQPAPASIQPLQAELLI